MSYKIGDIVLIKFPFTNLSKSKKRPVLIIKNENELNDIVCFQITSNDEQFNLLKISNNDLINSNLTLDSYIKYDKCFTLSTEIIDKKIATVNNDLLKKLKVLFCKEVF
ncbi:MAG: type II toxin-antitoxin system PemK/MazF family toxin [Campylobacterota bacterium]|nr:type II toxin-antitoxin system PemK/MazF family toxin [Campylobacterota bacterium]